MRYSPEIATSLIFSPSSLPAPSAQGGTKKKPLKPPSLRTERPPAGSWPSHLGDVTPTRNPSDAYIRMSLAFRSSVWDSQGICCAWKGPSERGSP